MTLNALTLKRLAATAAAAAVAIAFAFASGSNEAAGAAQSDPLPNATPGPHGSTAPAYHVFR